MGSIPQWRGVVMSDHLLACTPARSHLAPMLVVAEHLHRRGHRVRFLTGSRFRDRVEAVGVEHLPLPADADFDDADLDRAFPGRDRYAGLARLRFDVDHLFLDPVPSQFQALRTAITSRPVDAILVDQGFLGVLPLVLGPEPRPAVLTLGITPLQFASRDTAPFGLARPPRSDPVGRIRNRALGMTARALFRRNQRHARALLRGLGVPAPRTSFLDWSSLTDCYLAATVSEFEYPRSDLPGHVRFVGPLLPPPSDGPLPPWWDEAVTSPHPLVHVTQGTVDNLHLDRLVAPSMLGLADQPVMTLVSTGGSTSRASLPEVANARVADHLPYDRLLPRLAVMVTNGGMGGVQQALAAGVPLVVGGDSEDKPEVAARVAWCGAGIDLGTAEPTPEAVARAVRCILTEPRFRERAAAFARRVAETSAPEAIERAMEQVSARPVR
jgi:MGT family glycosyltransferase